MTPHPHPIKKITTKAAVVLSFLTFLSTTTTVAALHTGLKSGEIQQKIITPLKTTALTLKKSFQPPPSTPTPPPVSLSPTPTPPLSPSPRRPSPHPAPPQNQSKTYYYLPPLPYANYSQVVNEWWQKVQEENRNYSQESQRRLEEFQQQSQQKLQQFEKEGQQGFEEFRQQMEAEQQQNLQDFFQQHQITPAP